MPRAGTILWLGSLEIMELTTILPNASCNIDQATCYLQDSEIAKFQGFFAYSVVVLSPCDPALPGFGTS